MENSIADELLTDFLLQRISDEELLRLFSPGEEIQPSSEARNSKKIKTDKDLTVKFSSRSELMQIMIGIHKKLASVKEEYKPVSRLPDHCLANIFSHVPLCERMKLGGVCKRWRDIREMVWRDVKCLTLHRKFHPQYGRMKDLLRRCGPFVKKLTVQLSDHVDFLPMVVNFCKIENLESIAIEDDSALDSRRRYHEKLLAQIFKRAVNLTSIIVSAKLKNSQLECLSSVRSKIISTISVTNDSRSFSNCYISVNASQFSNLRELTLTYIGVEETSFLNFVTLTNLERLRLRCCKITKHCLSSIGLFTNLKEFEMTGTKQSIIGNSDISNVLKNCLKIEELKLGGFHNISHGLLEDIGAMPSLKSLTLENVEDLSENGFVHLTNVKKLACSRCISLKGDGIIELIKESSRLEHLDIHYSIVMAEFLSKVNEIFTSEERKSPLHLNISMYRLQHNSWLIPSEVSPLLELKIQLH